jgi:hypothetical protein
MTVRLEPSEIRPGVILVEVESTSDPGAPVVAEVRRGPCRAPIAARQVPPALALLGDELRRRLSSMEPDTIAKVKQIADRELTGRDEPYRRAVHALVQLREAAFWNQRWGAAPEQAVFVDNDQYWEGETLLLARRTITVVEALLPAVRDPATGWLELGSMLRLARQPDAARAALVEALATWPESHWAWLELAILDKGLGERAQEPPLSPAQREAHLLASLPAFDTAERLMGRRFTRRRDHERFWLGYVKSQRVDVIRLIGRAREHANRD